MTIRDFEPKDLEQVKELAAKYNESLPAEGRCIVAVDDNNKIVSFVVLRPVLYIEPFISENSIAGKKLFDHVEFIMRKNEVKILRSFIKKKNKKLLEKIGFYKIFNDYLSMEKNYYSLR